MIEDSSSAASNPASAMAPGSMNCAAWSRAFSQCSENNTSRADAPGSASSKSKPLPALAARGFDFELALPGASARDVLFSLHWLKARDHAAQFIDPGAMAEAGLEAALLESSIIGRHYGCLLALDAGQGHTDAAIEGIARATAGRVNYRVSGEAAGDAQHLSRVGEILWG